MPKQKENERSRKEVKDSSGLRVRESAAVQARALVEALQTCVRCVQDVGQRKCAVTPEECLRGRSAQPVV